MATQERGVLPSHLNAFAAHEVDLSASTLRTGQQIRMIVADEAIQRATREAVPYLVERLARHLVQCNEQEVRAAVDHYLKDRSWVEPIIEEETRKVTREIVREMLLSSELAQGLMDMGWVPRG